jgi:RNA polymerase sigma-70 factor (ECF subfamily)
LGEGRPAGTKENPIEDFEIVQAVLAGDREAFADLVRAYESRVRRLCLSYLLGPAEAEDAAQEVFVKAFASLDQYTHNRSFLAWLYRIAANHCLDQLRKRKRQRTDSLDNLVEQHGDHLRPLAGEAGMDSLDSSAEREDRLAMALQALSELPADQRQILVLRELDGLSYVEISSVLRCSLDAVKARLRRARQRLQERARHFMSSSSLIM